MQVTPATRVSEAIRLVPGCAGVLERYGIDSERSGQLTLAEAGEAAQIAPEVLVAEVSAAAGPGTPHGIERIAVPLAAIIDRVISRYHAKLHDDLPHVGRLVVAVAERGDLPGRLADALADASHELRAALEEHTAKEERLVFPLIRQLETGGAARRPPVASLAPPLTTMAREHEDILRILDRIRGLTGHYQPPAGASELVRRLYQILQSVDHDLAEHTSVEDGVLFPRALELEREARSDSPTSRR